MIVVKFGGSSVANDRNLNIVAQKIIEMKKEEKDVVVVVSAQGDTTDNLINEAINLAKVPNEREMDMLISVGEQITASKLSILLNQMEYSSISLTGWQAGIYTNNVHQNAKLERICINRIKEELNKQNIVIVTGFQGIDENGDITTLGRGGSDITAISLGAALDAEKCYIFSDVDGVYTADPRIIEKPKKLEHISFNEMQAISEAGAQVLHNRCIQIGENYNCNIIAKSTFSNNEGTKICKEIETTEIKSIVKNSNLVLIQMIKEENIDNETIEVYNSLIKNHILVENFKCKNEIEFYILKSEENKVLKIISDNYKNYKIIKKDIVKLSIVGYGIAQDNSIITNIMKILKDKTEILNIMLTHYKIEIILKEIDNSLVEELHKNLVK